MVVLMTESDGGSSFLCNLWLAYIACTRHAFSAVYILPQLILTKELCEVVNIRVLTQSDFHKIFLTDIWQWKQSKGAALK